MTPKDYKIFDLQIVRERDSGRLRAQVLSSPAGEVPPTDLNETVSTKDLTGFLSNVGHPRHVTRRPPGTSVEAEVKRFGNMLFAFLFPGPIATCLAHSRSSANANGCGLRIQIRLDDVPELCDLPWEFLRDDAGFLGLTNATSIVRFLGLRQPLQALKVTPPIRILAVISSPSNWPRLDVEREWENLQKAVASLEGKGLVKLQRLEELPLPNGKLRTTQLVQLNHHLRTTPCHILHFIGHGQFDEEDQSGQLYFEDESSRAQVVSADQLSTVLADRSAIRLVMLNACEGARAARTDPFAGTAQALIRRGVPAVIAMQFEVTDRAAISFASEVYSSLAVGDPIDLSVSEARLAIYANNNKVEWGTPVLYLRSADSRLFEVTETTNVLAQRSKHANSISEGRVNQVEESTYARIKQGIVSSVSYTMNRLHLINTVALILFMTIIAAFLLSFTNIRQAILSSFSTTSQYAVDILAPDLVNLFCAGSEGVDAQGNSKQACDGNNALVLMVTPVSYINRSEHAIYLRHEIIRIRFEDATENLVRGVSLVSERIKSGGEWRLPELIQVGANETLSHAALFYPSILGCHSDVDPHNCIASNTYTWSSFTEDVVARRVTRAVLQFAPEFTEMQPRILPRVCILNFGNGDIQRLEAWRSELSRTGKDNSSVQPNSPPYAYLSGRCVERP